MGTDRMRETGTDRKSPDNDNDNGNGNVSSRTWRLAIPSPPQKVNHSTPDHKGVTRPPDPGGWRSEHPRK
jgi:hypothetical protein